jgi:hypothetical protein
MSIVLHIKLSILAVYKLQLGAVCKQECVCVLKVCDCGVILLLVMSLCGD